MATPKYNQDAVEKALKAAKVKPGARKLTHRLLKGHQTDNS